MPLVEDQSRYIAGEEKYWLAFSRIKNIGVVKIRRLFDYFGSLEEAWQARSGDLLAAGLEAKLVERVLTFRPEFNPDGELERLQKLGIRVLTLEAPDYPARLAQIKQPPVVLYLKGTLTEADKLALAVVGTRRATTYGKQTTVQICSELVEQGVTIISGLALGIDTAAHQAAVNAKGRTLAVLGSGVDIIYPPENRFLAAKIIENGAILSEYAPGTQPEAGNFPPRNRIVSGLSLGVFLVECSSKSGALITVDFANEEGREVFALPGNITNPYSEGPNKAIQNGAKLVTTAQDILAELRPGGMFEPGEREIQAELFELADATDNERLVLRILRQAGQTLHIDEVCREAELPMAEVSSLLVLMELKGLVQSMGGMRYNLTRLGS